MIPKLGALQKEIVQIFAHLPEAEYFYLTGGTALSAFYLFHRFSEDLDFFTPEEHLVSYLGDNLKTNLEKNNFQVNLTRKFKSFYEMLASKKNESVRVHLALDSPFRFEKPILTELGIKVDSFLDIATNKLTALYGRFEIRDYVDIYFLIKEGHYSLENLIEKTKEKDPGLDTYYLAIAFEKIKEIPDELSNLPLIMFKEFDVKEMKNFFIQEAVKLLEKSRKK